MPEKLERCVKKVRAKSKHVNPWAICVKSTGWKHRKSGGSAQSKKIYRGKRPSPSTSATSVKVGKVMHGGDGKLWVCQTYKRNGKRIKRWSRKK